MARGKIDFYELKNQNNNKNYDKKEKKTKNNENVFFYYPYNFVQNDFNTSVRTKAKEGAARNSGTIEITYKNTSPLLIAEESQGIKEHVTNREGQQIIPASSFKGMLRNSFEIVTNSCFSTMESREEHTILDIRADSNRPNLTKKDFEIISGRIERNEEGEFYLQRLNSAWINNRELGSIPEFNQENKEVHKTFKFEVIENFRWGRATVNIVKSNYDSSKTGNLNGRVQIGYIKDTGLNFKGAHHQRFFYLDSKLDNTYVIDDNIINKYAKVIERQKKVASKTKFRHSGVEEGALVWGIIDKTEKKLLTLSNIQVPKMAYYNSAKDLLKELSRCDDVENLCYSCRTFGTTIDNTEYSLGGKLFFEDLIIQDRVSILKKAVYLSELNSPNPSNSGFYVGKEFDSYDSKDALIRGRKVYWHHEDKQDLDTQDKFNRSNIPSKYNKQSDLDRCILGKPLLSGNTFKGKFRFKDLTDNQLGAILLALGNEGEYRKIGAGKPLGMGSIQIKKTLLSLNSKSKYEDFNWKPKLEDKGRYIELFKKEMATLFKVEKFENISFIKDFNTINSKFINFSKNNYPIAEKRGEENTLNWFMNMKKEHKDDFRLPKILEYK